MGEDSRSKIFKNTNHKVISLYEKFDFKTVEDRLSIWLMSMRLSFV